MYEQVLFYNHFGNGDIFESREFVKACANIIPAKKYCYSHGKSPEIIRDITNIEFKEITEHMNPMRGIWDDGNGNLYINTWIGRDGSYVLQGIGCTVEQLYRMYNDMLAVYDLGTLPGSPIDYIPSIDYSYYNRDEVTLFMAQHPQPKIFIDNGMVQSMQAENFPMEPIIARLADENKDKLFIVTHALSVEIDNVITTNSITNKNGFDLNEISLISLYCNPIIGRNSGPHVFSQVKENCSNPDKKLMSFTYEFSGSSFVVNTEVKLQKLWSNCKDEHKVYECIKGVLG